MGLPLAGSDLPDFAYGTDGPQRFRHAGLNVRRSHVRVILGGEAAYIRRQRVGVVVFLDVLAEAGFDERTGHVLLGESLSRPGEDAPLGEERDARKGEPVEPFLGHAVQKFRFESGLLLLDGLQGDLGFPFPQFQFGVTLPLLVHVLSLCGPDGLFRLTPFHDGRDDIPPGVQRGVDLLVDSIFGYEMVVGDLALLPGAVDAGQRLVIVTEREAQRVVDAVARPGEIHASPAGLDLHGDHLMMPRLPFGKLVRRAGQLAAGQGQARTGELDGADV